MVTTTPDKKTIDKEFLTNIIDLRKLYKGPFSFYINKDLATAQIAGLPETNIKSLTIQINLIEDTLNKDKNPISTLKDIKKEVRKLIEQYNNPNIQYVGKNKAQIYNSLSDFLIKINKYTILVNEAFPKETHNVGAPFNSSRPQQPQ